MIWWPLCCEVFNI